jgi:hypothetical protein
VPRDSPSHYTCIDLFALGGETLVPRIAILIADSDVEPFPEIKLAQERYVQFLESFAGIDVFYFRGRSRRKSEERASRFLEKVRYSKAGRVLQVIDFLVLYRHNLKVPLVAGMGKQINVEIAEGLRNLGPKFLATLHYLSKNEYDFYYKTTLSSIANMELILEFLMSSNPQEHLYAGPKVQVKSKQFVSGSSLILSSKTARFLVQNRFRWNHGKLDDVAIGILLQNEVPISVINSRSFSSIEEVASVSVKELSENHHFRCKSNAIPRQDVAILRFLIERLVEVKVFHEDYI